MRRLPNLRLTRRLWTDLRIVLREVPRDGDGGDDPRVVVAARSISELFIVMGLALGGWIVYLALKLPARNTNLHYDLTWVGFDVGLLAAIASTAYFATRLDPRVTLAANATATLLLVDAWMDITSSASTGALLLAIAFAVLFELPVALISLRIAHSIMHAIVARARAADAAAARAGGPTSAPLPHG
jgi:hypothetical protein